MSRRGRRISAGKVDAFHRICIIFGVLVLWQAVTAGGLVTPQTLPRPWDVAKGFAEVVTRHDTMVDLGITMGQVVLGLTISLTLGSILGLLAWRFRLFMVSVYPWLSVANAVPGLLFYPLAIVLVGLGTPSIVLLSSMLGTLTMAELMLAGLRSIRPVYLEVARSMEASRSTVFRQVILPASFSVLLSALRVTFTLVFIVTIASQYILSGAGIGYRLRFAYELFDTVGVYSFVALIMLASLVCQYLLIFLLGRLKSSGEASAKEVVAHIAA